MNLQEKLISILYKTSNANYASELLEKIADEYAVCFRDFCNKRANEKPLSNVGLSTEELLIIFKKESKL